MSALAGTANEALHRVLAQVRRYGAIGPRAADADDASAPSATAA